MQKQVYELDVNGFKIEAAYYQNDIDTIFLPLLKRITAIQKQKQKQRRIFVFLAAPPGSGKSTLALFLQYLSQQYEEIEEVQAVGMDGFHYTNEYLQTHYMEEGNHQFLIAERKGCAKSFNTKALLNKLNETQKQSTLWPIYSRAIHEVVEDVVLVNKEIILLEGNYLLLAEEEWLKLQEYCDYRIFVSADINLLKKRLINRKIEGGLSKSEAEAFYERSDYLNIVKVNQSMEADLMLSVDENNHFIQRKE